MAASERDTGSAARDLPDDCFAVVIPSTRAQPDARVLSALEAQTVRPKEICWVHDEAGKGPAWARNRGIERTHASIVAFLDDDCVPPPDWLGSFAAAFRGFAVDIVGGTYEETDRFLAARRARQRYPLETGIDAAGAVGAGGNIAIRRTALAALKARDGHIYNERFRIGEDWELVWRLRAHGHEAAFSRIRVRHLKSLSTRAYLVQQFRRGIGIAMLDDLQKSLPATLPRHQSRLWNASRTGSPARKTFDLIYRKGIGPFDWRSFARPADFALFWFGEKCQGAGFLWHRLRALRGTETRRAR